MYACELTDKENKDSKSFRQIAGLGMIECVSIFKGTGCRTLTDLINWTIDTMEAEVASAKFRD